MQDVNVSDVSQANKQWSLPHIKHEKKDLISWCESRAGGAANQQFVQRSVVKSKRTLTQSAN